MIVYTPFHSRSSENSIYNLSTEELEESDWYYLCFSAEGVWKSPILNIELNDVIISKDLWSLKNYLINFLDYTHEEWSKLTEGLQE